MVARFGSIDSVRLYLVEFSFTGIEVTPEGAEGLNNTKRIGKVVDADHRNDAVDETWLCAGCRLFN